jgi:hypothetical protein
MVRKTCLKRMRKVNYKINRLQKGGIFRPTNDELDNLFADDTVKLKKPDKRNMRQRLKVVSHKTVLEDVPSPDGEIVDVKGHGEIGEIIQDFIYETLLKKIREVDNKNHKNHKKKHPVPETTGSSWGSESTIPDVKEGRRMPPEVVGQNDLTKLKIIFPEDNISIKNILRFVLHQDYIFDVKKLNEFFTLFLESIDIEKLKSFTKVEVYSKLTDALESLIQNYKPPLPWRPPPASPPDDNPGEPPEPPKVHLGNSRHPALPHRPSAGGSKKEKKRKRKSTKRKKNTKKRTKRK